MRYMAIFMLCMFVALGWYSYPREASYDQKDIERINQLSAPKWKTKQAAAIAEIYGLNTEEVMKPINLWGAKW